MRKESGAELADNGENRSSRALKGAFPFIASSSARVRQVPCLSKINKGAPSRSPIQLNPITFFATARPFRSHPARDSGPRDARAGRANTGGVPYRFETILEGGFTLRRFWFRLRGLRDIGTPGQRFAASN